MKWVECCCGGVRFDTSFRMGYDQGWVSRDEEKLSRWNQGILVTTDSQFSLLCSKILIHLRNSIPSHEGSGRVIGRKSK